MTCDHIRAVPSCPSCEAAVAFDHEKYLGNTLAAIAGEKAGIVKPGVPLVVGALPEEAWAVVQATATARGARVLRPDRAWQVAQRVDEERATIEVTTARARYGPVTLALRGEHQVQNALVAIGLLEESHAAGVDVPVAAVERGLSTCAWPGRLETLAFPGGRALLLDAAHNPDGARALARFLSRARRDRPPLVFAAMRDKDVRGILEPLMPHVGSVVVTAAPSPRTSAPEALAAVADALDAQRTVVIEPDPARAVERAWTHGPFVCVAGSIFLVGAVRDAFHPRAIVDSSP
jgi:dihydrofolate synthase/folylpolyglutamate synthase